MITASYHARDQGVIPYHGRDKYYDYSSTVPHARDEDARGVETHITDHGFLSCPVKMRVVPRHACEASRDHS